MTQLPFRFPSASPLPGAGTFTPQATCHARHTLAVTGGCKPYRPPALFASLLVVCPHPYDLDGLDIIQNLVDEPVLNIDPAGACTGQVAD